MNEVELNQILERWRAWERRGVTVSTKRGVRDIEAVAATVRELWTRISELESRMQCAREGPGPTVDPPGD